MPFAKIIISMKNLTLHTIDHLHLVVLQHIHKISSMSLSKTAIHENLDPQNISAIWYYYFLNKFLFFLVNFPLIAVISIVYLSIGREGGREEERERSPQIQYTLRNRAHSLSLPESIWHSNSILN